MFRFVSVECDSLVPVLVPYQVRVRVFSFRLEWSGASGVVTVKFIKSVSQWSIRPGQVLLVSVISASVPSIRECFSD